MMQLVSLIIQAGSRHPIFLNWIIPKCMLSSQCCKSPLVWFKVLLVPERLSLQHPLCITLPRWTLVKSLCVHLPMLLWINLQRRFIKLVWRLYVSLPNLVKNLIRLYPSWLFMNKFATWIPMWSYKSWFCWSVSKVNWAHLMKRNTSRSRDHVKRNCCR